jgi:DmsE family decaheme c-type cytochrome
MKRYLTFPLFIPMLIFLVCLWRPGDALPSDGFLGTAMCKGCHENYFESYAASVHGQKAVPNNPENKYGCETCHGPGGAHLEKLRERGAGIFIFSKQYEDAQAKSAKCLACHEEASVPFWDIGKHKAAGVSCDTCHTIHSRTVKNLKAKEPDLCNICHRKIAFLEEKQSHHPIKEGRMKCTNCHEQHGGFGEKMIKGNTPNDLCFKCHAEKRGPFMWAHPPVEENCLNCHTPHGSNNPKLLVNRVPMLCQSCHNVAGHPSNAYTLFETFQGSARSNRMYTHSCLNCHSNIHGDNGPSTRGQFFVR